MTSRIVFVSAVVACCLMGCSKSKSPAAEAAAAAADNERAAAEPARGPSQAPERFSVELTTTKGPIVIDVRRDWSPRGADRFFKLVQQGYYDDVAFYRVIEGFIAQVGVHGSPRTNKRWSERVIRDEAARSSNIRGAVSFASTGPNSRTTQVIINLGENSRLDGQGFAPFGSVRDMTIVDQLYSGYGVEPSEGQLQLQGNSYLEKHFPKLDYIESAMILETEGVPP